MYINPNFTYNKVEPFDNIKDMLSKTVAEAGDHIAYRYKDKKGIHDVTYREFEQDTFNLGAALTADGFGKAFIACCANNRYEWIVTYLTVLKSAGVFVPIDRELPLAEIQYLLNDSGSEVVFYSEKYESYFIEHRDEMPNVKFFIGFDREEDEGDFLSYQKMTRRGANLDPAEYRALESDPHALKDLVYTSGTTGKAKGVMLSEHNLCSSIYYGLMVSTIYTVGLSVLPFNHTYEAVCEILVAIHKRVTICINDNLMAVLKNLQLYQPDFIYLVPAIAEMFYKRINSSIDAGGKRKAFNFLIKLSRGLRKIGIDLRRKLFKSVHSQFGGNLREIVCGGAPIRPVIGEFFIDIGMPLIAGYGITECSPLVSVNPISFNDFNTAGCRLPCVDWKIDDPNEEGIGEIVVKGDIVMLGYFNDPEQTADVLKDGWFYTGDYGYLTDKDQLVITGRKKNLIVLSNGKNIYPEELESHIMGVDGVKEVVVRGLLDANGLESSLMAEIYLEEEVTYTKEQLQKLIREEMQGLPDYKRVSSVVIRDEPFVKTTSNKIKR